MFSYRCIITVTIYELEKHQYTSYRRTLGYILLQVFTVSTAAQHPIAFTASLYGEHTTQHPIVFNKTSHENTRISIMYCCDLWTHNFTPIININNK